MTTKRTLGLGAGITVIAATVATPLLAGSAAASAHSFTVRMHSLQDTSVDNGAKGFSPGDDDVQATRLTQGGKTVGWEAGDCLTARVAKTGLSDEVVRILAEPGAKFEDVAELVRGVKGRELLETGKMDAGLFWGGQVQGLINDIPTAKDLIERIAREAEEIITSRLQRMVA